EDAAVLSDDAPHARAEVVEARLHLRRSRAPGPGVEAKQADAERRAIPDEERAVAVPVGERQDAHGDGLGERLDERHPQRVAARAIGRAALLDLRELALEALHLVLRGRELQLEGVHLLLGAGGLLARALELALRRLFGLS